MSPTVLHTTWQILGSWQKEALDAQICARVSGSPSAFLAPRTPPARRCRPSPARLHVVLLPRNSSSGQHFLTTTAANVGQISLYNTPLNDAQQHGVEGGVRVRLRFHQEGVHDGTGHGDAAAAIHSTNGRLADTQVPTSLNRFLPFPVF